MVVMGSNGWKEAIMGKNKGRANLIEAGIKLSSPGL
jgi:hypothetical protein